MSRRKILLPLLFVSAAVLAASLTLRYLGRLLGTLGGALGEETQSLLADVFGQLESASIVPHILIPLLLWGGFVCLLRFTESSPIRNVLLALLAVFLFVVTYVLSLCLTRVNGIRFWDILSSLIRLARNGLFESL